MCCKNCKLENKVKANELLERMTQPECENCASFKRPESFVPMRDKSDTMHKKMGNAFPMSGGKFGIN